MAILINKTLRIEYPIQTGVIVGRSTDSDIQLNFPTVSKQHFRVFQENGQWFAEDLGSSNSTYLNGEKIHRSEIRSGDYLRADAYTLAFFSEPPPDLPEIAVQDPGSVIRQRLPITQPVLRIGRSLQANHLPIDDPAISAHHLEISRDDRHWQIRFVKEGVKVRVNEQIVGDGTYIIPGDRIKIGSTILEISIQIPQEWGTVSPVQQRLEDLFRSLRMQARTIEDAVAEQYPSARGANEWISTFLETMTLIDRSCKQLAEISEQVRTMIPSMENREAEAKMLDEAVNYARRCNNLANYLELILHKNQLVKIHDSDLEVQKDLILKLYQNIHGCLEVDNPTARL